MSESSGTVPETLMDARHAAPFADRQEDDPELHLDIVRDAVREQFPQFAVRSIEHLGSGSSFDAYAVDDAMVFKFPRHAAAARDLDRIDRIQTLVASAAGTDVGIPRFTLWGTPGVHFPHRFVGHPLIRGVAAWSTPESNPELADDVGHALARIHAIPLSAARELDLPLRADSCQTAFDEVWRKVKAVPEIETLASEECEWLSRLSVLPSDYDGTPRLVHSDLLPRHIIVNETTGRLSGIIDWTPALGDPAGDFSYLLFCRRLSFLRRAVDAYQLDVDAAFVERTILLARLRALDWVSGAVKGGHAGLYLPILRSTFSTD